MLDFGKETVIKSQGKTFILGRLELHVVRGFRDWIKEQVGDPFAEVERLNTAGLLSKEEALVMVKEAGSVAKQLAQFSMGCPLAQAYGRTEMGLGKLVHLAFLTHHPDMSEEQAWAIMLEVGEEEMKENIKNAAGKLSSQGNPEAPAAST